MNFTLSLGVKALEFDVLLTADQVPVITHNHRVSAAATRNPDGQWLQGIEPKVATLSLAQLQELDVGGLDGRTRYGQKFSDQAFLNGRSSSQPNRTFGARYKNSVFRRFF